MIKTFKVEKLAGKFDFDLTFNEDINIITGRNGSGKTLLMKLMWYCLSGNIELALREIPFDNLEMATSNIIIKLFSKDAITFLSITSTNNNFKDITTKFPRKLLGEKLSIDDRFSLEQSAYFPTFRRFDGGYGIDWASKSFVDVDKLPVHKAISEWSALLSKPNHRFITSVSMRDIAILLNREYGERSERANQLNAELEKFIRSSKPTEKGSESVLTDIKSRLNAITEEKEGIFQPFTTLATLISNILGYPGIAFNDAITPGEKENAINAEHLSLGEKQLLSFLCYNIFLHNASIFIDEPENSLHPDWQRRLIPLLMEQNTSNQFFIATHSPFIYTKYADKELNLNPDRGGE